MKKQIIKKLRNFLNRGLQLGSDSAQDHILTSLVSSSCLTLRKYMFN